MAKEPDHHLSIHLLEVVLSATPVRYLTLQEQQSKNLDNLTRRRRQALERLGRSRVPPPLNLTYADNSRRLQPPTSRLANKWDHFCRLYESRDALCAELDDPDADAIVYTIRAGAQRQSPWWHAALVDRNPAVLSNTPALWYPVLATEFCRDFVLTAHDRYVAAHAHLLMPPRTVAGKALRSHMRQSDLLGSFHQELLDKVQLETAPLYRADMALALLFLVIEAFAGEVLPPVYMVHVAVHALTVATGRRASLPLDAMVSNEDFQDAVFVYLERWVETAFVLEWKEMLSSLLGVITPALPVALRLVVDSMMPTATDVAQPGEALWQWALPISFSCEVDQRTLGAGGWWVTFPTATARALESSFCGEERGMESVLEANQFEEFVQWSESPNDCNNNRPFIVGSVVRHEALPMPIRRHRSAPPAGTQPHRHESILSTIPDDLGTSLSHTDRLAAMALQTFTAPHVSCDGPPHTPPHAVSHPDEVDWGACPEPPDAVPPYATVCEDHWSRDLLLCPFPTSDDDLKVTFASMLENGVAPPRRDVQLADYGPPYVAHLRAPSPRAGLSPSIDPAHDTHDAPPFLWNPTPHSPPKHVVSMIVCCGMLQALRGVAKLPESVRTALRDLRAHALWRPRPDKQDVILHYYDGYCSAKAAVSLVTLLRLLHDADASALDALVLFGTLTRRRTPPVIDRRASKNAVAITEQTHPTSEALNIQLLPAPANSGEATYEMPGRAASRLLSSSARLAFGATRSDDECDECADHDTLGGEPQSFTCDVFSSIYEARMDRIIRPLLITTGGAGVVRYLVNAIKSEVLSQKMELQQRGASQAEDPLSVSTSAFAYEPEMVANRRHIRIVIEAAPPADGWAQPLGGRSSVAAAGHSWKPSNISTSGALALELQRLNPTGRVQLPLGGLRMRPHREDASAHQRGKAPEEISFPEATVSLAVFHDRIRRNRRFLFNAVKSTSPPPSPRSTSHNGSAVGSNPGSPTSSLFGGGLDMRAALAQLRDGGIVPITNMSLTTVFRSPEGPSPMGLGTLIHGAQGGSALDQPHGSQPKSKHAMQPTSGSKRKKKRLVPMAEASAHQASQRRSMRRSSLSPNASITTDAMEAPHPVHHRRASYLEGNAGSSSSSHPQSSTPPPQIDDDGGVESWRTRSRELRSGAESPWTVLPPLKKLDAPLRVLAPEAARRRVQQSGEYGGVMLPVLKPHKRFEQLRKKAQSAPPFF